MSQSRYRMLHELFDVCLANYLMSAKPPEGKERTSIYDPISCMIEHGNLLEHSIDELLQAWLRAGYSFDMPIVNLMRWSYHRTVGAPIP